MTSSPASSFQRRRLRDMLRSLREQKQLTQAQVAQAMEWSPSKIIRIELGSVGISVTDLRALLTLYAVDDQTTVGELLALARAGRRRSWLSPYKELLAPGFVTFVELESEASEIRAFQATLVPGLFETRDYAKACIVASLAAAPRKTADAGTLLEIRMRRQRDVFDQAAPPQIRFILDEAVLRRKVGGSAVMRAQLDHLADLSKLDHVHITVVPFDSGAHAGSLGSFLLMDFPGPSDRPVLYQEDAFGVQVVRDRSDLIANYRRLYNRLVDDALDEAESLDFIRQMAEELT